ncbi:MAG: molybdopterin-dependent oxidoreductase [Acidimicrobiales bacterium]
MTQLVRPLIPGAVAGVTSAGFGLAVAQLVAATSQRFRSPVIDVGDRVVDRVPVPVKDLAISWFGTNDKIALLIGIASVLAIYSAGLGVLALRDRLMMALVGVSIFGLAGSAAALGARTGTDWIAPLPSLIGATVAGFSLVALAGMYSASATGPAAAGGSRRQFLLGLWGLAIGAGGLAAGASRWSSRFSAAGSRSAIGFPAPARVLEPIPAAASAEGAAPLFTSNAEFYRIDTALSVPQVPAESWTLTIKGMVDREIVVTYAELLERDLIEADITLTCVSNTIGGDLIGTARWLGVRLDDLLDEAGIQSGADQVVGRSVDGYSCGFPVAALDGRDALIAVAMNGEALPIEHGFPARLIVPGIYGYASATKWLSEIELTTYDAFDHYWVPRGYAAMAPIKLQSRIDSPRGLDRIAAGPFAIGGVAWAQTIGIDAVEVKIDDLDWQPANLADEVNNTTWRQWSLPWDATPGRHTISVRATDRNGQVQTDERAEPLPNGASGRHTVVVLVDEA